MHQQATRLAGLVAAVAACVYAGPVAAASPSFSMLAELDNITVTLSALDPSKPVAPGFDGFPTLNVNSFLRTNDVRKDVQRIEQAWWSPASYRATDGFASTTASWTDKTLRLTASSNDASHFGQMSVHGEYFQLPSNARLTVEADARLRGSARDVYLTPDFNRLSTLNAYLALGSGTGSMQFPHDSDEDELEYTLSAQNNDGSLLNFDVRRHLSVSFTNPYGVFGLGLGISGKQQVTPVPEPQAYALMLAGLVVVGAEVRRRRKKGGCS